MPGVEEWAKLVVAAELGRTVEVHDDGSQPSMYDLRVGSPSSPEIAIECTGAVDRTATETWNIGPATGPVVVDGLTCDWMLRVDSGSHQRRLREQLPDFLTRLESKCRGVRRDHSLRREDAALFAEMQELGVESARVYREPGTGQVNFTMAGSTGFSSVGGADVATWIGTFAAEPVRADNLAKLAASGAPVCELFVIADLWGVPDSVMAYLTSNLTSLPDRPPRLPAPLTGVWITASIFARQGIRWTGSQWRRFDLPARM